jgi:putative SOS response-associated peptidase YedK
MSAYGKIERMCGRFTLTNPDPAAIAEQFHLPSVPQLAPPRYNVAPTQPIAAVIHTAEGANQLQYMFWGLIPSWSKDGSSASKMINARAETVAEKPAFRAALAKRRCLIIADGFYEWKTEAEGPKTPMRIGVTEGNGLFAFAGLFEKWAHPDSAEWITTCTIITTAPNALMRSIHNRMPVILPPEHYAAWLDYKTTDTSKVLPLLTAFPPDKMRAYPVSRAVNNPRAEGPELIQPI